MSDTTHEAPERIWVEPDGGGLVIHNNAPNLNALIATGYLTEYIRADLVQAVVAAKLKEAVAAVKKDADNDDISHGAAQWVSDTILDLITPDAQAALDRVVAARFGTVRSEVVRLSAEGKMDNETVERLLVAIRKGGE